MARCYGALLAQADLDPNQRSIIYREMPERACPKIKDAAKGVEDAQPFVAFLEQRLGVETDERMKRQLSDKLAALRKNLEGKQ